jgi:uncharacterized membrane protein HdeD (DUF308 family)
MTNQSSDRPASEAVSTAGLFLNIAAVIALVMCLGALAASQFAAVAVSGTLAVVSFGISLVCFAVDERRSREDAPAADVVTA